ncbi:MAG: hypothetical protein EPO13_02450 [Actinomycetota bacterium]|nr:MAG: hypothetical protein EPO13_02450 [Actinomycetota bacterium]
MSEHPGADRLAAWSEQFEDSLGAVMRAFQYRWTWRAIIGMLRHSEVPQHPVMQDYLLRTYIVTICMSVRVEADDRKDVRSLARSLRYLSRHAESITYPVYRLRVQSDFEGRGDPDRLVEAAARSSFDIFAGPGGQCLDPTLLRQDLDRLFSIAKPVVDYTNQVIAHRGEYPTQRRPQPHLQRSQLSA